VAGFLILAVGAALAWWGIWIHREDPPVRSDEAHRYFLEAEGIVDGTPKSFLAAIALYSKALTLDPHLAPALSGRAMNQAALTWSGSSMGEGLEAAEQDAQQALALDPKDSRAQAVLGSLQALRGHWLAAERSFHAAINSSPSDADVRSRYAVSVLLPTGQVRKAVAEATTAQQLAPTNAFTASMLALAQHALGSDETAVQYADLAEARGGDPRQLVLVHSSLAARNGQYDGQ
jgi:Flp pilus assembly protein TadD